MKNVRSSLFGAIAIALAASSLGDNRSNRVPANSGRMARYRHSGTGEQRAKRSRELVDDMKAAAERKRNRREFVRRWDAEARDARYYHAQQDIRHCFHRVSA